MTASLIDRQERAKQDRERKMRLGLIQSKPTAKVLPFPEQVITTIVDDDPPVAVWEPLRVVPVIDQTELLIADLKAQIIELKSQVADLKGKLRENGPVVIGGVVKPVLAAVAKYYEISLMDMLAGRRTEYLVRARHIAMYLAIKLTGRSYPHVGKIMGRDHTTVLHGFHKIRAQLHIDPKLQKEIAELTAHLTMEQPNAV